MDHQTIIKNVAKKLNEDPDKIKFIIHDFHRGVAKRLRNFCFGYRRGIRIYKGLKFVIAYRRLKLMKYTRNYGTYWKEYEQAQRVPEGHRLSAEERADFYAKPKKTGGG